MRKPPKPPKARSSWGWVIDSNSKGGLGVLGKYWFDRLFPDSVNGYVYAVFPTRKNAWRNLDIHGVKNTYQSATVRRVRVVIHVARRVRGKK